MKEDEFRLRRGQPADAPQLAAFAARTFRDTFAAANRPEDIAAYLPTAYGISQQASELANAEIITLILDHGATIVAYAQVRLTVAPDCVEGAAPAELWRFYVDQPWHGRGLAPRLMSAVHDAAAELGGRTLWLGVWEKNERAIAFYKKCGFRDVGQHDFWLGDDRQTDRIMLTAVTQP